MKEKKERKSDCAYHRSMSSSSQSKCPDEILQRMTIARCKYRCGVASTFPNPNTDKRHYDYASGFTGQGLVELNKCIKDCVEKHAGFVFTAKEDDEDDENIKFD